MTQKEHLVIAHLSLLKVIPVMVFWFGTATLCFWAGWRDGDGYGFFVGGIAAFMGLSLLYSLLVWRGRGVWIKNGELIYMAKYVIWEKVDEIAGVGISRRTGVRASIVLRTKSRGPVSFPTFGLVETRPVIRARLCAALGLPDTGEH